MADGLTELHDCEQSSLCNIGHCGNGNALLTVQQVNRAQRTTVALPQPPLAAGCDMVSQLH
jgi:hypothetical protein